MVVRRRRKIKKYRGSRTVGRGCAKRGRGSGEKGGKGFSGGHKQKWSYVIRYMPDYFGKHGSVRPAEVSAEVLAINVGDIDEHISELVEKGIAKSEENKFIVDVSKIGVGKVLGGGRVTHSIEVIAKGFSESAKKKLEKAGGKVVVGGA